MGQTDLLLESLRLMGIGMGIVFCFLMLLVALLKGMSRVASRLGPPEPLPTAGKPPSAVADDELVAVIGAAIAQYRARRR
jgi:oxaloacetate decarboxylase (Na+ extruding) subunit gamma